MHIELFCKSSTKVVFFLVQHSYLLLCNPATIEKIITHLILAKKEKKSVKDFKSILNTAQKNKIK